MRDRLVQSLLAMTIAMPSAFAGERLHLLGFVAQPCRGEALCFELRVEPAYVGEAGARITVRYDAKTRIFDPENYELDLERSALVPGSHLRMVIEADPLRDAGHYRALSIWKGD